MINRIFKAAFYILSGICVTLIYITLWPTSVWAGSYPDGMDVFDATVWVIQDIPLRFKDEGISAKTIVAGTPAKVVAERGEDFYVRIGDCMGLVPKDICMINLSDVMQQEMDFDITNSYDSIFMIHGYSIPGVTGEALYPYVAQEGGEFLVPLLFPVAERLYAAERYIQGQGYTIRVYDAYRPHTVTREIYDKTSDFIDSNPQYRAFVTEGGYRLSAFLAKEASNHNYGVAVDIALIDMETGEEVEMQTPMHELSPLAATKNNTYMADMLATWMKGYGFTGIVSEWWHFEMKGMRKTYADFQANPYEENKIKAGNH